MCRGNLVTISQQNTVDTDMVIQTICSIYPQRYPQICQMWSTLSDKTGMKLCICTIVATILLSLPVFLVQAQTLPCGNITGYDGTTAISNCADPFGVTTDPASPYELVVGGQTYQNGSVIPVVPGAVGEIRASGTPRQMMNFSVLYKHDGNDYRYVNQEPSEITPADYRAYIEAYFTDPTDRQRYLAIFDQLEETGNADTYFNNEDGSEKIDPVTGETVATRYYNVYYEAADNYVPIVPTLALGTYTLVITDFSIYQTYRSIWDTIWHFIIPTAYAQFLENYTYTLTFTLTEMPPEPTGASSVLFLPGIQASRLYLGDGNQVFNRIWEPSNNTDVRVLGLSPQGTSLVDIRTNDVIDEASLELFGKNIYKGFMSVMDNFVEDEIIKDWTPFAYDWRYDVFDIARNGTKYLDGTTHNPVDEIIRLANTSYSGKVTIIAHSNGGLLAKAIMLELKDRGREDLIDTLVFIGTPQLGTPKAIGTVLHGYDQEALGGLIVDDGIAREVIRNLPGVYSLLPTEKYFEVSNNPVIYFDNSVTTQPLRTGYGSAINSLGSFNAFMVGVGDTTGRSAVTQTEVNKPILVNNDMYFAAQASHKLKLDNWVPPAGTTVFQVIGTGLPTMKAVEYREIKETVCPINAVSYLLCTTVALLKPQARFTPYGDETVVSESARYSKNTTNTNKYYFDLDKAKQGILNSKKTHSDLTESSQVQDFIEQIIKTGSSSQIEFFSQAEPTFSKNYDIEEINSPVQISTKDSQGRITGVVLENGKFVRKEEIPDSTYLEFGGTKYVIVPSGVNRTSTLVGESLGGYTLTLSSLDGAGAQLKKHEVVNATTTPTMVALYSKINNEYSSVKTDYDADGVTDYENTVDGAVIVLQPKYTYQTLVKEISALTLKKTQKNILLALAKEAEKLHLRASGNNIFAKLEKVALKLLESTILLYQRQQIISKVQAENLLSMVRFLSK